MSGYLCLISFTIGWKARQVPQDGSKNSTIVTAAQPEWSAHGGRAPNLAKAWQAAASTGIDVARARRDMTSPDITGILNQDMADAAAIGADKTPTFFVNGRPLPSFGVEQLLTLVDEEVAIARKSSGS